jgi:tetratricopeptide (TPR) repeat protein
MLNREADKGKGMNILLKRLTLASIFLCVSSASSIAFGCAYLDAKTGPKVLTFLKPGTDFLVVNDSQGSIPWLQSVKKTTLQDDNNLIINDQLVEVDNVYVEIKPGLFRRLDVLSGVSSTNEGAKDFSPADTVIPYYWLSNEKVSKDTGRPERADLHIGTLAGVIHMGGADTYDEITPDEITFRWLLKNQGLLQITWNDGVHGSGAYSDAISVLALVKDGMIRGLGSTSYGLNGHAGMSNGYFGSMAVAYNPDSKIITYTQSNSEYDGESNWPLFKLQNSRYEKMMDAAITTDSEWSYHVDDGKLVYGSGVMRLECDNFPLKLVSEQFQISLEKLKSLNPDYKNKKTCLKGKLVVKTSLKQNLKLWAPPDAVSGKSIEKLLSKGDALYHQKKYDAALIVYQQAIDADYRNAQSYSDLGLTCQRLGRFGDALIALITAANLADSQGNKIVLAGAYYNIGRLYEQYDEYKDALSAYRSAKAAHPNHVYDRSIARVSAKLDKAKPN